MTFRIERESMLAAFPPERFPRSDSVLDTYSLESEETGAVAMLGDEEPSGAVASFGAVVRPGPGTATGVGTFESRPRTAVRDWWTG